MNREIKFRGWNVTRNKMSTWEKILDYVNIVSGGANGVFKNKDLILMQYIGLKDRNDLDIFEGDIVRAKWERASKGGYFQSSDAYVENEIVVIAVWHTIGFMWQLISGTKTSLPSDAKFEIIGNIFETPELITIK